VYSIDVIGDRAGVLEESARALRPAAKASCLPEECAEGDPRRPPSAWAGLAENLQQEVAIVWCELIVRAIAADPALGGHEDGGSEDQIRSH